MYYSKYNLVSDLEEIPGKSVLCNMFHGGSMLLDTKDAHAIEQSFSAGSSAPITDAWVDMLKERGFVYNTKKEEEDRINQEAEVRRDAMSGANAMRSYLILLSYGCNFRCPYCFQDTLHQGKPMTQQRLSKVFDIIVGAEKEIVELRSKNPISLAATNRPPHIGLIGGEPLQMSKSYVDRVLEIVAFSKAQDIGIAITTNGYHLKDYVPLFKAAGHMPADAQVTIDGIYEDHNKRRPHHRYKDSFERIVEGVDAATEAGMNISLRVNVDKANIDKLTGIIDFIEEKGWYDHPLINPYIGPITNHSGNIGHYTGYDPKTDVYKSIIDLATKDPRVVDIFKLKNFLGHEFVRSIVMEESKPVASFWRCEAVLGQMVFGPEGRLYSCFESAGQDGASIGTFDPVLSVDKNKTDMWAQFAANKNPVCSDCKYVFICAGGCPWNTIKTGKPECLSVSKQVQTAWNYYFKLALG